MGDLNVYPSDVMRTTEGIAGGVAEVVRRGGFSVCLGGDHYVGYPSCLGYTRGLSERAPHARVGYIHIDGHLDFADTSGSYGKYNNGTNDANAKSAIQAEVRIIRRHSFSSLSSSGKRSLWTSSRTPIASSERFISSSN